MASLWRNRDFRLVTAGQTVTQLGTDVTAIAFPLVAIKLLDATPFQLGVLVAVQNGAFFLIGLPAGVFLDRRRRRPILIVTDLVRALALGTVTLAAALHGLSFALLLAVAAVMSLMRVVFEIGYQTYLPSIVPRHHLVQGNATLEAIRASGQIAGPALGGWLVHLSGAANALLADAVSFVLSAVFLWRVRTPEPPPATARRLVPRARTPEFAPSAADPSRTPTRFRYARLSEPTAAATAQGRLPLRRTPTSALAATNTPRRLPLGRTPTPTPTATNAPRRLQIRRTPTSAPAAANTPRRLPLGRTPTSAPAAANTPRRLRPRPETAGTASAATPKRRMLRRIAAPAPPGVFHEAREGVRFVLADPVLRGIAATSALSNLFFVAANALNILFLVDTVGVSAAVAGTVFSIGSAAALVAAAIATRLARRLGSARIIWLSVTVTSPFNLLIPLTDKDWRILFFVAGITVSGGGQLVYAITQLSYRQAVVPPAILGRVNATMRFLVMGALPLGALIGGTLGTLLGIRMTLSVIAVGLTIAPIFVLLSPLRGARDIAALGPSAKAEEAKR
ncbi:hypothetical protein Ade02nite_17790 [Paractinoplanes deccanensis]|uniref:MFS transporter n=2 Tax=Paractinoplanes deccanensis TaxID=113561 RepID=A0ABQ3XZF9_9ACTN|nr:hypothetical protein Ade02nite_17790 [Actinoplanes deccanensis]